MLIIPTRRLAGSCSWKNNRTSNYFSDDPPSDFFRDGHRNGLATAREEDGAGREEEIPPARSRLLAREPAKSQGAVAEKSMTRGARCVKPHDVPDQLGIRPNLQL